MDTVGGGGGFAAGGGDGGGAVDMLLMVIGVGLRFVSASSAKILQDCLGVNRVKQCEIYDSFALDLFIGRILFGSCRETGDIVDPGHGSL